MVGQSLNTSWSGREALPEAREWSRGYSRRSGNRRESDPADWEWSVGPLVCAKLVGRPCRRSGSGLEPLPEVWEWLEAHPMIWEWLEGPP